MVRRKAATVQVITSAPRRRRRKNRGARSNARGMSALGDSGKEFVRCALDPFGADSARVPTGTAQRTMHVKYTCMVSGKPRAGQSTMSVLMLPGLPGSLRLVDGTFTAPDRSGAVGPITVVPNGTPIITVPFEDFYTPSGDVELIPNRSSALATARVVGYGLEVRASATIINQGGVAVTAKIPYHLSEAFVPQAVVAGPWVGVTTLAVGTQLGRNARLPNTSLSTLQQYPDSKMCSGTDPCRLIGEVDDYEQFWPVLPHYDDQTNTLNVGTYVLTEVGVKSTAGVSATGGTINPAASAICKPVTGDTYLVGDFWTPPGTQGLCWTADSLTDDSLYEFRVVLCIEATIEHDEASVYRPFVSKAPPQNERALAMARKALQAMPASLPPPDRSTGSWWSILSEAVTGFGDIVGGLDLPVVSGVARTATRLARMMM